MRVAYRVQHALGREPVLARLSRALDTEHEVVTDEDVHDPNPLRNYLRCLADVPRGVTHVVVIQDDALPCEGFTSRVQEAIEEKPDVPISLFVGGLPGRTRLNFLRALKEGERWSQVYFREIHHVVAVVWPAPLAEDFLAWYETARIPGAAVQRSDDAVVSYWARMTKRTFWATVPCLVEHPDDVPSTIGRRWGTNDRGRRAIHFAG